VLGILWQIVKVRNYYIFVGFLLNYLERVVKTSQRIVKFEQVASGRDFVKLVQLSFKDGAMASCGYKLYLRFIGKN